MLSSWVLQLSRLVLLLLVTLALQLWQLLQLLLGCLHTAYAPIAAAKLGADSAHVEHQLTGDCSSKSRHHKNNNGSSSSSAGRGQSLPSKVAEEMWLKEQCQKEYCQKQALQSSALSNQVCNINLSTLNACMVHKAHNSRVAYNNTPAFCMLPPDAALRSE